MSLAAACSSSSDSPAVSSGESDAQTSSDVAADSADATPPLAYPAFPFDMPNVPSLGGPIVASPNVVAIFDPTDPNKDAIMTFLKGLESSSFWPQVTSEYGVGPIASVTEMDLPSAMGATVAANDLLDLTLSEIHLSDYADAGPDAAADNDAGDAGVPRTDKIFVIFTPPTTTISDVSCGELLGYHASLHLEGNVHVPYAIVQGACTDTDKATTPLGVELQALGHELVEAATDPFPSYDPAFLRVDDDHLGWTVAFGALGQTELNDLCDEPIYISFGGSSYALANVWSNKAAKSGLFPCVPSSSKGPLLMASAVFSEDVPFTSMLKTKGITLAVGKSATIDVHVSSSAALENSFQISAVDIASAFYKQPPQMTLSLDKTDVQNGDVVHLTITRTALSTAKSVGKGAAFSIRPTSSEASTWMPFYGFVADP
ncbi:MAG: hypothetical protein ABI551_20195 [Polyangiaceae bacterium]